MVAWGPIAAAGIGAITSAFGAHKANKAAQASSREQMAFQERSYKHRYQWQMADMKAAGLNPMLAYSSSAPGALSGTSYRPQNVLADAPAGVSSALQATRLKSELKNIAADTRLKNAQQQNTYSQSGKAINEMQNLVTTNAILKENLHSAEAAAEQARQTNKFFKTKEGKVIKIIDLIGRGLNPFASAGSSAKSAIRR